jgi:2-keto-4-pentenoate hydratase/2-oxohepta-3-ene-1,7-dioic acid hydratase in catechol pathway
VIVKSEHTFPGVFQVIEIPPIAQDNEMDYQVSLAIIIGRMCKNVREEEALDYVLGYTCANEFTARKVEQEYGPTYAKSEPGLGPSAYSEC